MYRPKHSDEQDGRRIRQLVDEHGFATVICAGRGSQSGLEVSHLPLLFEETRGEQGALLGHMARANGQWKHFETAGEVLAIFHGPHGYVSPTWYEPGPAVPTWNYAAVHVYGKPRLIHDPQDLKPLVARLVKKYEAGRQPEWTIDLAPDFEAKMLAAIVGFEIAISRVEAKFKLSQNRPLADRRNVIEALEGSGSWGDRALSRLMRETEG